MEYKDELVKALEALVEIGGPVSRLLFVDFIMGNNTPAVADSEWQVLNGFGVGKKHSVAFWTLLISEAIEKEYVRVQSTRQDTIRYTSKGRKFIAAPESFPLDIDEKPAASAVAPEEDLIKKLAAEKKAMLNSELASNRTKLQIKLIHAIDRKMALDDFAETENVSLDEILDELDTLQQQGRKLDIRYFANEIIAEEDLDDLFNFFDEQGDDMEAALDEYDDVFQEQELRLARLVWRTK